MTGGHAAGSSAARPATVAVIALCATALLAAVAAAWTLATSPPHSPDVPTTGAAAAAACAAAILLLGIAAPAGLLESRVPRRPYAATAVAMLACSWSALGPLLVPGSAAALRLAAYVFAAMLPAALLHLVGALRAEAMPRWVIPAGYGLLAALAAARSLATDPFLDPQCRIACDAPAIVLVAAPALSYALGAALTFTSAVIAAAVTVLAVRAAAHRPPRGLLALLAATAAVELGALLLPESGPVLGPPPPAGDAVLVIESTVTAALAIGLLAHAVGRARRVAALQRALEDAARAGGSPGLGGVLSRALGDPGLRLDFWLPTLNRWADDTGAAMTVEPSAVRAEVTIRRRGDLLARVRPVRSDMGPAELLSVIDSAALLLIDNERLRVERLAQATALRESRLRIVEASDSARRQLERDLHDGAQQRLLAAILAYRLAADEIQDAAAAHDAAAERDIVLSVLGALREAAQGIYPPVLADSGLVPAIESLVRTAQRTVSVTAPTLPRLDSSVEFTVYLAVREALARSDTAAAIRIRRLPATLSLEIAPSPLFRAERLTDRVGALGGSIRHHGDGVILEVPCA